MDRGPKNKWMKLQKHTLGLNPVQLYPMMKHFYPDGSGQGGSASPGGPECPLKGFSSNEQLCFADTFTNTWISHIPWDLETQNQLCVMFFPYLASCFHTCVTFCLLSILQKEENHEAVQSSVRSSQIHAVCGSLWHRSTRLANVFSLHKA